MRTSGNNLDAALKSAKILLVGADFATRKLMRTLLLAAGVTDVHDAADGVAGLAAAAELDPDVIVLDWQVPPLGGAEFVARLRARAGLPHASVPIVMLTDHRAPARVIEAMRLGVREFLVQPVSGATLRERLASALALRLPKTHSPSLVPVDAPSGDAIVAK